MKTFTVKSRKAGGKNWTSREIFLSETEALRATDKNGIECKIETVERDINEIVPSITSFENLETLIDSISKGYCPTIYPRDDSHRVLTAYLRGMGHRVYTGASR